MSAPPDIPTLLQRAETLARTGQAGDASRLLEEAILVRPGVPALRVALGRLALAAGSLSDARRHLEAATVQAPHAAPVLLTLGKVLLRQGELDGATRVLERLTRAHPDRVQAWVDLGEAQLRRRNLADADKVADVLAHRAPGTAHAHRLRALVALERGRLEAADAALRAWLEVDPTSVEGQGLLADLLSKARRFEEATARFESARARCPDDLQLATRYAAHLGHMGDFDRAHALFRSIAEQDPSEGAHLANRGIAELWTGDLPAAIASLRAAVEQEPENPSHRWNLSHALLQSGDLAEGFAVHEQRGALFGPPAWWADRWRGEALAPGTPLVLDAVQGLGDAIQFARFAQDAAERGARVVVRAHPRLHPLLACTTGVSDTLSSADTPAPGTRRAELLSMPRLFDVRDGTHLGHRVPYIRPEPARLARWTARLAGPGLRVGIVWQGNPGFATDHLRSPPLRHYLPLTQLSGVSLFSLQKFHGIEQLDAVDPALHPITDLGPELDLDEAFLDTAAAMVALDLVLTSDTSTAHLAGALGVPTWVVLPYAPDWRWPREGDSTPWYPTMRLFRQPAPHAWEPTFAAVEAALRRRAGRADGSPAPPSPSEG